MLPIFMLSLLLILTKAQKDPASKQLETFKQNHPGPPSILTTSYGVPVDKRLTASSLNTDLLRNPFFLEMSQHSVRERIPARVVHAKGTGAFGYLEITDDISKYCRAKVFSKIGKRIPLVVRMSTGLTEKGGSDTTREPRGLAIKLYTEEGNLDIVCLSTPMYAYKDPLLFPSFSHVIQRNPETGLRDSNMIWDFITLRPESLFFFLFLLSDRGIPDGYRHLAAFNIHTMQVVNKNGESYFMRFHFLPDAGIKNLTATEAARIAGEDLDYATRDLYNAIAREDFPSWTLYVQILSLKQVMEATFDPFDVTNILPVKDYPLKRCGKLVLNKNPENQFAQIEQLAFNPGNLPDGFVGGPGKLFESREFVYRDAQVYRLGTNFNNMAVNCPLYKANTYNRDGVGPVVDNGKNTPNFIPNSFGGPVPVKIPYTPRLLNIYEKDEPENFGHARDFYENELTGDDRGRLIQNMVAYLAGAAQRLQFEAIKLLTKVHPDLGHRVAIAIRARQTSKNTKN
ncbi:hypothetical protein K1T71_004291 [Dendrolimus kikuchii]|uniref:Uncharacterized protein n=1 Tax=Dendrolimus kikuchii TaxID=765133 RepID=A0ACC1D771_9NEOP|nr:hypothetical protein K1T71_004291 [Dendrolimus kikuchii]